MAGLVNGWDKEAFQSRIADSKARLRYEAGSPNQHEIAQYKSSMLSVFKEESDEQKNVLVLGMTPELRQIAIECDAQLISIDNSCEAIKLYREWCLVSRPGQEKIKYADWMDIDSVLSEPVDSIIGDGVFGNILSLEGHIKLLKVLRNSVKDEGAIILRQALVPTGFISSEFEAEFLLDQYRQDQLTPAEFGFSMRLWGSFDRAYNQQTCLLDNAIVFKRYVQWVREKKLTEEEYKVIHRYFYGGKNMLLPQHKWENLLLSAGLTFERFTLKGKTWYGYYPIYFCQHNRVSK